MFDELVESSSSRKRQRRWRYFTVTAVVWTAALTLVIAGGVVAYEGRLGDIADITHIGMPRLPPERSNDSRRAETKQKAASSAVQESKEMVAHPEAPNEVEEHPQATSVIHDAAASDGKPDGGGTTNSGGPTKDGVEGGSQIEQARPERTEPAQPQPEKKIEEPTQREVVRKSGGVFQGSAIKRVSPMYPPLAKVSRTSGAVVVEVVVDESGNVISARALSGHPLLREAAVAAAYQWKWKPTLLSNVPVQVVGTITFNFAL